MVMSTLAVTMLNSTGELFVKPYSTDTIPLSSVDSGADDEHVWWLMLIGGAVGCVDCPAGWFADAAAGSATTATPFLSQLEWNGHTVHAD